MNSNRTLIMNFTSDPETVRDFEKFEEYFAAYKSGASMVGEVSMEKAHQNARDFISNQVDKRSGKKASDWSDNLKQYCSLTDVSEIAFSVISVLTDMVIPNVLMKQLSPIAEFHNMAWGDTLKIQLKPRDLFLPSKIGRGKRLGNIRRMFDTEVTIPTYLRETTVGIDYYDILTGKYSLAEYVAKASAGMEAQIRYDVWDAFAAAVGGLDASGNAQLVYTGYTQDVLIALAEKIGAWNNSPAIILGTKTACSKILPASTNYRFDLDSPYIKEGSVRDFFGIPVIQMEQIANYATEFAVKLDNTKLYVISPAQQKIIHVAMEGGALSIVREAKESAHLVSTSTIMKSWGVAAATSALAGVITLN
jgi:hypothetical protein